MPKEVIRGTNGQNRLQIGWTRDQYVEVGTFPAGQGQNEEDGWFLQLDRRGINDAIRKLRHARDQAFGKDE